MERLVKRRRFTPTPILAEACFLLTAQQRRGLDLLVARLPLLPVVHASIEEETEVRSQTFECLARYKDVDFCDAYLATLASRESRFKVWSYDRDFVAGVLRRRNGTPIPLATK